MHLDVENNQQGFRIMFSFLFPDLAVYYIQQNLLPLRTTLPTPQQTTHKNE